jgi:hypothetical protein
MLKVEFFSMGSSWMAHNPMNNMFGKNRPDRFYFDLIAQRFKNKNHE